MKISIDSEVGTLETVIIHQPGAEIETVTPASAEELLYNDVIPLAQVQREHRELNQLLSGMCTVLQSSDLLLDALGEPDERTALALELMRPTVRDRLDQGWLRELSELPVDKFLQAMICGVPNRRRSFEDFLSDRRYDIPALPNWYFMRDAAMAYLDGLIIGSMAFPVRRNEALLARRMLNRLAPLIWDGSQARTPGLSIEGGDFLVAGPDTLLVGLSERTSAAGLDMLLASIMEYRSRGERADRVLDVIAVQLPHARTCIHLDMVANFLDWNCLLVYEPLILNRERAPVIHCRIEPGKTASFSYVDSLPEVMSAIGMPVEIVSCGGGLEVSSEREQWLAGNNVFAYGPGQIVAYDCNPLTLDAMSQAGFEIVTAGTILSGSIDPRSAGRRVVTISGTELARGGGGVRCMTMPLCRSGV